jgi:drug/metabolite transporter (DMT)-like permease
LVLLCGLTGAVGMVCQMEALRQTAVVHVIAIKRLSTLMSATVGVTLLDEPRGGLRLPAAALMLAGAIAVLNAAR